MSLSLVNYGAADGDAASITGVSPGDHITAIGFNHGTAAVPGLPSGGWATPTDGTVQATGAGDDCAARVVEIVVPSGGLASVTFPTSCNHVFWLAHRSSTGRPKIGGITPTAAAGNTSIIRYGALELTPDESGQWLIGFGGRAAAGLNLTTDDAPSDLTFLIGRPAGAGDDSAIFTSNGVRSTDWPETDVAQGGIACQFVSFIVEVLEESLVPPLAPTLSLSAGAGFVQFATSDFAPHPNDPTDTHQSTKYQLSTSPTFGTTVVDVDLGAPNLLDYQADGLAAGTYYGRAAHVGEDFDGDWSNVVTVVVSDEEGGDQPTISLVEKGHDYIEDEITNLVHDNPEALLVQSEFQIRTTASGSWAPGNILETAIAPYFDGDPESLRARYSTVLTGGTSYTRRGRQLDSFGAYTPYSADIVHSTDAVPTDKPDKPTATVDCGRDVVVTGSAYAHSAMGAGTAHEKTEARVCYGGVCRTVVINSPVETYTWPDQPPGEAEYSLRYGDDSGRWGDFSDVGGPQTCTVPDYPPHVVFTDPAHGEPLSANKTVTWEVPGGGTWHYDGRLQAVGGAWSTVFTDQVAASYAFNITGRPNGEYWLGVRARNPDTDELGEETFLLLSIDRTGLKVFHIHFGDLEEKPATWRQVGAGEEHVTFDFRDEVIEGETYRLGLIASNVHSGLTTRYSGLAFDEHGQPDEFDQYVTFEHIPKECGEWYPYRFSNAFVTRGGGLMFAAEDGLSWRATVMDVGIRPHYLGAGMGCVSGFIQNQASAATAQLAARFPTQSFRYGRTDRQGGAIRTVTDRTNTATLVHASTTLPSSTSPRLGGPYVYTDSDGILGIGRQLYTMHQRVRRGTSGGQTGWLIKTRLLGPGIGDSEWHREEFVREYDASGRRLPCGSCGIAFEDLDRIGVGRSEGILFTDFTLRIVSYGSCEPEVCQSDWRFTMFEDDNVTPWYGEYVGDFLTGHVTEADFYSDRSCPRPYLMAVKDFSETEIDYPAGASTIGQIRVGVLDKRVMQSQDTGIVTAKIANAKGRRALLERWREDLGYVTVMDGVVDSVSIGDDITPYWLDVRDPRERERGVELFTTNETFVVYPEAGPVEAYGQFPNNQGYLLPPVQPHNAAEFARLSPPEGTNGIHYGVTILQGSAAFFEAVPYPQGYPALNSESGYYEFPDITVRWRLATGGSWVYLRNMPSHGLISGGPVPNAFIPPAEPGGLWRLYMSSLDTDDLPAGEALIDVQVLAAKTTPETPYMWDQGTFGDLLLAIMDGEFSDELPNLRFNRSELEEWALNTPRARMIVREPAENLREWVQEHIFAPLGHAPTFDQFMRVMPTPWELPDATEELVELDPDWIVPVGDWSDAVDSIINRVVFKYTLEYLAPQPSGSASGVLGQIEQAVGSTGYLTPWERLVEQEVTRDTRFEPSMSLGENKIEYEPVTLRSLGGAGAVGLFSALLAAAQEAAPRLAAQLSQMVIYRFGWGVPEYSAEVRSGMAYGPSFDPYTLDLRVGQWVKCRVPWLPEYSTGVRGMYRYMQIASITDPEIHVRRLRLIDGGPVVEVEGESDTEEDLLQPPTLGTLTEEDNWVVKVPVTAFPAGAPSDYTARVDYAVVDGGDPVPDESSALWLLAGYLTAPGDVFTPGMAPGFRVWIRARGEAPNRRPSVWTTGDYVDIAQVPALSFLRVTLSGSVPTVTWIANAYAVGVRIRYSVGVIGHTVSYTTYGDRDATLGSETLSGVTVGFGQQIYVEVTPYPGWTAGGGVTGTPGATYVAAATRTDPQAPALRFASLSRVNDGTCPSDFMRFLIEWGFSGSLAGHYVRVVRFVTGEDDEGTEVATGLNAVAYEDEITGFVHDQADDDAEVKEYLYAVEIRRDSDDGLASIRYTPIDTTYRVECL